MTSSARVWRAVAERQRQHGNSVGPYENEAGGECLMGSMAHLRVSAGERRRAQREFQRVTGSRPEVFNDFESRSAVETWEAAERVADVLEAREAPKGLPAGQPKVSTAWWSQPQRERAEASRG